jgi:hypothetical protein
LIIDAIFFIDVVLSFFTVVFNKKGIYETNLKTLAILYLKGWFFVDFTTSIPYYIIDSILSIIFKKDKKTLLLMVGAPRLYRLLRIIRIFKILGSSPKFKKLVSYFDYGT